MKTSAKPYIGVTGFIDRSQVEQVLLACEYALTTHQLMVGVAVNLETLQGHESSHWPERFPAISEISGIFVDHKKVINLVHFSWGRKGKPLYHDEQAKAVSRLMSHTGKNCHGIQFNMIWPAVEAIRVAAEDYGVRVLQIGKTAIEKANFDPETVAEMLLPYGELVTDILFDMSAGHGKEMDTQSAIPFLRQIQKHNPHLRVGMAGGLYAGNVAEKISPFVRLFSSLNIDAEGKLMGENGKLYMESVCRYVEQAQRTFDQ